MHRNTRVLVGVLFCALFALPFVSATELGVNYYHESMMSQKWGVQYIPRTIGQVDQDLTNILQISRNVKFYMNPFVDANLGWVEQISSVARGKGFSIALNMMVDDRQLSDSNWGDYSSRVKAACGRLAGKVDTILVGNEIILHSPWNKYEARQKIEPLIAQCKSVFPGEVSYEGFWYEKEAWYDYSGKIYFMFYESLSTFQTNLNELKQRFGTRGLVGEWGEDIIDEGTERDHTWQRDQLEKRWNIISGLGVPIAYVFTYKEPSWNGFGVLHPDGAQTPAWQYLKSIGSGSSTVPAAPTCAPSTEVCDGKDNNCNGQTDEGGVCSVQPPSLGGTLSTGGIFTNLVVSCSGGCALLSDQSDGVCRTVRYQIAAGQVQVQGCDKGGGWMELYRQAAPSNTAFQVCFANGCVNKDSGFARFQPSSSAPVPAMSTTTTGSTGTVTSWSIGDLKPSCTAGTCTLAGDTITGACRVLTYTTSAGSIKAQGCDKGGGWMELYLQQSPNTAFTVCLGGGCITQNSGFARFKPTLFGTATGGAVSVPQTVSLATLALASTPAGTKVVDTTLTACRTVSYATSAGNVMAKACDKGSGRYELYLLSTPNDASICVGSSCVGRQSGFAVVQA